MKKELKLPNMNINIRAIYLMADANLNNVKSRAKNK